MAQDDMEALVSGNQTEEDRPASGLVLKAVLACGLVGFAFTCGLGIFWTTRSDSRTMKQHDATALYIWTWNFLDTRSSDYPPIHAKPDGHDCQGDEDCEFGFCLRPTDAMGTCGDLKPDGHDCERGEECESGFCLRPTDAMSICGLKPAH